MTVSLGTITLDDNLRLDGVFTQPALAGSARPTLGGICIQSVAITGGKVLQLVATRDGNSVKGLFTGTQLAGLAALRDAGAPVALVHHLGTFQVWIPPDGISVEQVFDFANPAATDWYVGTLTLITVS
jgi:hypothetical protein